MNSRDRQKLTEAGYRFIRSDQHSNSIKVQSNGTYSHGWKTLEKGFKNFKEVEKRMNELLKDKKTIEL